MPTAPLRPLSLATATALVVMTAATAAEPENWNQPHLRPEARVALTAKPPAIDGVITPREWQGLHVSRFVGQNAGGKDLLQPREGAYDLACDGTTLFVAIRSAVHPVAGILAEKKPLPDNRNRIDLVWDDGIELWIDTLPGQPGGRKFNLNANSLGALFTKSTDKADGSDNTNWRPAGFRQAHRVADGLWTAEFAIPLADLEIANPATPFGIRVCRNFKYPWDQSRGEPKVVAFDSPETMSRVAFAAAAPLVRELGFQDEAGIRVALELSNPGTGPLPLKAWLGYNAESQPRYGKEFVETLAPGQSKVVEYKMPFFSGENYPALAEIRVQSADGATLYYQRDVKWHTKPKPAWDKGATAKAEEAFELQIGWYPTPKLLHWRANYAAFKERQSVKALRLVLTDSASGKTVMEKRLPAPTTFALEERLSLPELPQGDFTVSLFADLDAPAAKPVKTEIFEHATDFPWQKVKVGISDVILPPFTPIQVTGDSAEVILRRYQFSGTALPAQITSLDKNLLTGPIRLESRQSNVVTTATGKLEFTEKQPHRAVATAAWAAAELHGSTRTELDYDGCLKVTLTLAPTDGKIIDGLDLVMPLADKFMPLMHSVGDGIRINYAGAVKPGTGKVWGSAIASRLNLLGSFIPYLWLGAEERGLCWFAANDRGWVVDPTGKIDSLTLERQGDTLNLRVRLIQVPTAIDRERTITFGLMATPAKPMSAAPAWRGTEVAAGFGHDLLILGMCSYWGANLYAVFPASRDFTLIEKIAAALKTAQVDTPYFEQYQKAFPGMKAEVNWSAQPRRANGVIPYTNLVGDFTGNREWRVYQDEWRRQDFQFRTTAKTGGGSIDFVAIPVSSRQDYLLYYYRELLRHGFDAIYWDNMYITTNENRVMSDGWYRPDGQYQGEANIWQMRELAKRTAVLCHELGKPNLNIAHMTNANLIPVFSWNGAMLDWEWKYGDTDFQDRWSRDYVRVSSIGRQAGCIPVMLEGHTASHADPAWIQRTQTGVTLTHELIVWQPPPVYTTIKKQLHAHGLAAAPAADVFNYWAENPVATVTGADTSWIVWKLRDEVALLVCDYATGGDTVTIKLDTARLGLPADFTAVNGENPEEKASAAGGTFAFKNLKKHDFRLFVIPLER